MMCRADAQGWVRCPVCGCKTRAKVRPDTVLERFPLFCPKCHHETLVDYRGDADAAEKPAVSEPVSRRPMPEAPAVRQRPQRTT